MADIENYTNGYSVTKKYGTTAQIQQMAKQLHDLLPAIKEEFEDLQRRNEEKPNEIFPIKMAALSDIYKATKPLYTWYVERAKK